MVEYKKKASQIYHARFYHQIFQTRFSLIWCEDPERIERLLNFNTDENVLRIKKGTAVCDYIKIDGLIEPTISFPYKWKKGCPQQTSLLAHECIHATIAFFRFKKINLPKDLHYEENDEENFCYNYQWLLQECLFALNEQEKHKYSFHDEKELIKK